MLLNRPAKTAFLWLLLLTMIGCQTNQPDGALDGRVTVWHSWPVEDAVVLQQALSQFEEIHPNVRIAALDLDQDQILDEFLGSGNDGLGPAVLIGSHSWIGELAAAGLIRPLTEDGRGTVLTSSRARSLTTYDDQQYGFALSLAPNALYYNKTLVANPPETLGELLQEARSGNQVALVPQFEQAYWGIQAFGEGLFDEQGQLTLEGSGFEEWLGWLSEAQNVPGVIMSVDDDSLLDLFISGQVAYYVAGPDKQGVMAASMSEAEPIDYGVAPLPEGPHGPAGPLLPADVVMVYAFASAEQARIADELAAFLVNQQQSIRFMRELEKVPANPTVSVDRRVYPTVSGFAEQVNSAVVIPTELADEALVSAGNRVYTAVLSGALSPAEAVCRFGLEFIANHGGEGVSVVLPPGCEQTTDE